MSIIHEKIEFDCKCWSWCTCGQKAYFRSEADSAGITTIYFKNCSMQEETLIGCFNDEEIKQLKYFIKEI